MASPFEGQDVDARIIDIDAKFSATFQESLRRVLVNRCVAKRHKYSGIHEGWGSSFSPLRFTSSLYLFLFSLAGSR